MTTGDARGLGEAIARQFHRAGARLALCDLNGEAVAKLAASLDDSGGRVIGLAVDVTSEVQVKGTVDRTVEQFGRVDVLVNCAGILKHTPIEQIASRRSKAWCA